MTFQPPPGDGEQPSTNRNATGRDTTTKNAATPAKSAPTKRAKSARPEKVDSDKAPARKTTARRAGAVPAQGIDPAATEAAPAKRTPRKTTKATPVPAQTGPAQTEPIQTEPIQTGADVASGDAPEARVNVARYDWATVLSDPGQLPELLALAAVETIGPRAHRWATSIRQAYPSATPQAIARLAVAQCTRRGGVGGALAAVAGSYAPAALLGVAGWTQAEVVLHVAAAHGQDPADPARAADLLLLTRVHLTREGAEAALAAAQEPGPRRRVGGPLAAQVGRPLATQVGGWLAARAVSRLFPGTGVLVAALASRAAAEAVGVRAIAFYRAK